LLDQAPGMLDGLGRAVAVVERDEVQAPLVDATVVVQQPDVGSLGLADLGQCRGRTAVGHDVADPYLIGVCPDRRRGDEGRRGGQQSAAKHDPSPIAYFLAAIASSTSRSLSLPK